MNKDIIAGNWKQLRGKVQQRWGKLTNDELDVIAGKKDVLVGKVQEHYGQAKEEAQRDVDELWESADDELKG
ncbi:MAG: CsbD family protein [Gemmatimonadetes bacterium]|nr:CsbD family protein [Gemmatimonadota bacterium]MBL0179531.1 CsbD family protein [Gemmatimonadota bacterium]